MENKKSSKNNNNFLNYIKENDLVIKNIYRFIIEFKQIKLEQFIAKYISVIVILVLFLIIIPFVKMEFFGIIDNLNGFIQIYYREIPSYILFIVSFFNLLIAYSNFQSIKKFNSSIEYERKNERFSRMETYIEWLKGQEYYLNTFKAEHNDNFDFMPSINLGLYIIEDMSNEKYVSPETIWGLKEMQTRINKKIDEFNNARTNNLKNKARNKIFKNIDTALKFLEIAKNNFDNNIDYL